VKVKTKTKTTQGPLAAGIRSLRQTLGETQEGMARRLGISLSGYKFWESGDRTPRGRSLQKLLALCPTSEGRGALFGLDAASGATPTLGRSKRSVPARLESPSMQARNTAMTAIDILFELSEKGSEAAHQELLDLADRASKRAGDLSRSKSPRI
jgi:transcriptional regulator with XRE-family HTH domain